MNEFQLLKHIIANCDDALRESFEKRMSIAESLLKSKQDLNYEIYDPPGELAYIQSIISQLSPELLLKANSLWSSLTRMNRSQQYRFLLKGDPKIAPEHEKHLSSDLPEGVIVAPDNIAMEAALSFNEEVTPCHSIQNALEKVINGEAARAVLSSNSIYDADSLYLSFYDKELYINSITRSKNGVLLYELSKKLVKSDDRDRMTLAFAVTHTYGSMAQTLSILSEAKLNIEHLRLRRSTAGLDYPDNLVFVDLSGDFNSFEAKIALYQMEKELYFFRLMGFWKSLEQ